MSIIYNFLFFNRIYKILNILQIYLFFFTFWPTSPFFPPSPPTSRNHQSVSQFSAILNFALGFYMNLPLLQCRSQRMLNFCFSPLSGWHSSSVQLVLHPQCCSMRGNIPTTSCCRNFSALEATMLFLSKDQVALLRSISWSLGFSVCCSSPQLSKPPVLWIRRHPLGYPVMFQELAIFVSICLGGWDSACIRGVCKGLFSSFGFQCLVHVFLFDLSFSIVSLNMIIFLLLLVKILN